MGPSEEAASCPQGTLDLLAERVGPTGTLNPLYHFQEQSDNAFPTSRCSKASFASDILKLSAIAPFFVREISRLIEIRQASGVSR
jgi:hypothetical protein